MKQLQDSYAVLPQAGEAQLRIYNSYNCPLHIDATGSGKKLSWTVGSMGLLEEKSIPVTGKENLMYSAAFVGSGCPTVLPATVGILDIFEAEVQTLL